MTEDIKNQMDQPAEEMPESGMLEQAAFDADGTAEVIGVRFKVGGKIYFFDPCGMFIPKGENVIIDTARGTEFGECANSNHRVSADKIIPPLRKVLRIATKQDLETLKANAQKEKQAFDVCQEKIAHHNLDMKLVDVEYSFDSSKILFFFTSDGRVDFRDLVKDLASVFRTRIELRQIGVRDEAKMLGGLGICGRPFCCHSFLDEFQPVSIKMAKTQSLSLNPAKISGTCGRLMCCLKYEQEAYEDLIKNTPKLQSFVQTPGGKGTVTEVNLLRGSVKVSLDNDPDTARCYKNCDICILRNGKGKKSDSEQQPQQPVDGKISPAGSDGELKITEDPGIPPDAHPAEGAQKDKRSPSPQRQKSNTHRPDQNSSQPKFREQDKSKRRKSSARGQVKPKPDTREANQ